MTGCPQPSSWGLQESQIIPLYAMPVTSYLLASCPGYFHNFHLARVAPEVETTWESQPQDGFTFAPTDSDESSAPNQDSLLSVCGSKWWESSSLKPSRGMENRTGVLRATYASGNCQVGLTGTICFYRKVIIPSIMLNNLITISLNL